MSPTINGEDPYARLPDLYDLEHADFAEDVGFYLHLAEVIGDPILELGCGTGRILLPLAKAGWHVTGLDQSSPMLDRARARLQDSGASDRVTLHEAPMSEAANAPGGPFGLVLISLNGLMHLPTLGEQRAALQAAYEALDPRGMLVVDLQNPSPTWLEPFDGRVLHEGMWIRGDGEVINRFSARTHSAADQRLETDLWYDLTDPAGSLNRVATRFSMRYVHRAELELMLELAGFVEWKVYGSYELDLYDDSSERLIVTAEVTPGGVS